MWGWVALKTIYPPFYICNSSDGDRVTQVLIELELHPDNGYLLLLPEGGHKSSALQL